MKRLDQLLLTICFVPTYVWYVRRMGEGGEDLLSALLWPVCFGIAYYQQKGKAWNIGLLTVSGTVLYVLLWSLGVPAMIKATLAITVLLHASGLLRNFGFSALAYLSLPWLSSFQFFFGYPLRRVVAEGAAFLLKFTGLAVEAEGTGLSFQGASVLVDPPCSGVRMLWAILVLVGLVSVIASRGWRSGTLLCLGAIIMAVMGNVLRAVVLFFPEAQLVHWPAWTHEAVGIIAYILTCSALFFTLHLLTHVQKTHTRYVISH